MSRIDFAYGATHRLRMACRTTARHIEAGHGLMVYCTDARRLRRFDTLLWEFDPASFIPHVPSTDPLAPLAPVLLVDEASALHDVDASAWLLNLDLACPPGVERFARVLEIVSGHEADVQAARARWMAYQQAGHDVHGHRLSTQE
ncbi:MAG TPA: DNA polymerase III subunit chi [Castellaniella sp.]|uniref:DNA polymerase III subunit chi n=1 Tax=Castellaniella sp. TaxID=1955812 RepID=UPI002EE6AF32